MSHQTFSLHTKDQLSLFAQIWEPADPQAVVCLVHGIGEHSGRYAHVAQAFNAAGFALLGFDHRGHGKSAGKRGHTPNYATMLDDVAIALEETKARYPQAPVFLYGHSMGGNLVLNFALRRKPSITGVLCTSPWIKLTVEPPTAQVMLARTVNRIYPGFTQSNGLDVQDLARDPEVARAYQADPLVHDRVTARLFVELYEAGSWALEHANELTLPLLLVHGNEDRITSPKASQEFAAKAGEQCSLKIWQGHYHETHNEPDKDQVLHYNLQWLEKQLP